MRAAFRKSTKKKTHYGKSWYLPKNGAGFTLIELLLYLALISIMVLVISSFMIMILQSRVKNQTITEVEQQGLYVMQLISQTIRNSNTINSPLPGQTAAALSLNTPSPVNNPTVFNLTAGQLSLTEGAGSPTALTSARVSISNLNFQNLSLSANSEQVRVSFTLSYVNPDNRNEFEYSKQFVTSAQLRP
ncbi:hypothetical protein C4546_03160 [Candidatus Parcubacteria bacterium]|nr:MAG: hypothetical protein C4546_03160 [Candidatus Parcubacteria bacterium]